MKEKKLFLSQKFIFEAAHTLRRDVPAFEKESSMTIHGHTYTCKVTISGNVGNSGMLVDLFKFRKELEIVKLTLDHKNLDDVPKLGSATLENLCLFIFENLKDNLPIYSVCISRQTGDSCEIMGE